MLRAYRELLSNEEFRPRLPPFENQQEEDTLRRAADPSTDVCPKGARAPRKLHFSHS